MKNTILTCSNHEEIIPLISTMAFNGGELWCPHCGANFGIFDNYNEIEKTEELINQRQQLINETKEFLSAIGTFTCSSLIFEGKRITPMELPESELQKRKDIIKNYKYKYNN